MNISTDTVADFLSAHDLDPNLASEFVEFLRADETRRGQQTDTRNIHDYLKSLSTDEVKDDLAKTRSNLVVAFYNVLGDFNLSSGIRNANWYNIEKVWIIGRKKWDRRGAVGSHNYIEVDHNPEIISVIDHYRARKYAIVSAEISDKSESIVHYPWNPNTFLIFGEEGAGVPQNILDRCDDIVHIPGRGSVRSLNVATTAGIFMHSYSAHIGLI